MPLVRNLSEFVTFCTASADADHHHQQAMISEVIPRGKEVRIAGKTINSLIWDAANNRL